MNAPQTQTRTDSGHDPFEGIGANGMIVTGARRSRISVAFQPVLDRAMGLLKAIEGAPSLYVYGSVATGTARLGSSDVDLVTIGLDHATSRALAQALSDEFRALCRGVEIGAAQLGDYEGDGDEAYGNRVFLRHYCVHLAGPDLARDWPEFPADRAAARGFNGDIGLCADRWRAELSGAADPETLARRVARKTLLAVAGLVSVHDTRWTTDRFAAARRWAALNPRSAPALEALVAWGSGEAAGVSLPEIQRALDGVVADVVRAFDGSIGLWRPAAR